MKIDLFPDKIYHAYGIFITANASYCKICFRSSSDK